MVARDIDAGFLGVWLEAPAATLASRIEKRVGDPSDATAAVLKAQVANGCGALAWHRLQSDLPLDIALQCPVSRRERRRDGAADRPSSSGGPEIRPGTVERGAHRRPLTHVKAMPDAHSHPQGTSAIRARRCRSDRPKASRHATVNARSRCRVLDRRVGRLAGMVGMPS